MNTELIEQKFKVSKMPEIKISNIRGKINVSRGKKKEINVAATKHLDSGDVEGTTVLIAQDESGLVTVLTEFENNSYNWGRKKPCKVEYEITVPENIRLRSNSVSGDTTIAGLSGKIEVKTVSGDISAEKLSGELRLHSVSGRVLGNELVGPIKLENVSGDIELRKCNFENLDLNTVSGKVVIESPIAEGPYRINSVSGSTKFIVDENSGISLSAHSISGRFKTSLNTTRYSRSHGNTCADINGGGTKIRSNSVSGNIYILSSEDDIASVPSKVNFGSRGKKHVTSTERKEILEQIHQGNLSIDDALTRVGSTM